MGLLSWIILGFLAGLVARFLVPGEAPGGILMTIALGIIGALVGGFLGRQMGFGDLSGFDLRSLLLAVGGAVILLLGHRFIRRR